MRYTTAASLADYMQTEIRISASVMNSGTLSEARMPTDVANAYTGSSLSGNTITFSEVDGGSETLDLDLRPRRSPAGPSPLGPAAER